MVYRPRFFYGNIIVQYAIYDAVSILISFIY